MNGILAQSREALNRVAPFQTPIAVVLGAAVLGGLLAAWQLSRTPPDPNAQDRWSMPQWRPYAAGAARDEVVNLPIWSEDPAQKPKVQARPVAPPWRFVGTISAGERRLAVIETDGGAHIKRVAPGEELPNGATVKSVDAGALTFADNGTERTIKLFDVQKPESTKQNP